MWPVAYAVADMWEGVMQRNVERQTSGILYYKAVGVLMMSGSALAIVFVTVVTAYFFISDPTKIELSDRELISLLAQIYIFGSLLIAIGYLFWRMGKMASEDPSPFSKASSSAPHPSQKFAASARCAEPTPAPSRTLHAATRGSASARRSISRAMSSGVCVGVTSM